MGGIGPKSGEIERVAAIIRRNGPDAVEAWKHQFEIWHHLEPTPLVSACIDREHYWLQIGCWSCKKTAEIDLRKVHADDGMTLSDVQQRAKCRDCRAFEESKGPRVWVRDKDGKRNWETSLPASKAAQD